MFRWFLLVPLLALAVTTASPAADETDSTGPGQGIVLPSGDDNPCPGSTLFLNDDGSFENGYAWRYGGVVPPNYGSFAEGYQATGTVCGIRLYLTTLYQVPDLTDLYVYDADGLNPDQVLSVTVGVDPGLIAIWPAVSVHDLAVVPAVVDGEFFVSSWGDWPGGPESWFYAADLDGPGGVPRTNIAPGIGYPTGWQHPEIVWGPTHAMGIGAFVEEGVIPVIGTSWGRIKSLY